MSTPVDVLEEIRSKLGNLPERLAHVLATMPRPTPPQRPGVLETPEGRTGQANARMGAPLGLPDWRILGASIKGLFGGGGDKKEPQLPPVPKANPAEDLERLEKAMAGHPRFDKAMASGPAQDLDRLEKAMAGSPARTFGQSPVAPAASTGPATALGVHPQTTASGPAAALGGSASGSGGLGGNDIATLLKELTDAVRDLTEQMQKQDETDAAKAHGIPRTPGQTVSSTSRSFGPSAESRAAHTGSTRPRVSTSVVDSQTFTRLRSG